MVLVLLSCLVLPSSGYFILLISVVCTHRIVRLLHRPRPWITELEELTLPPPYHECMNVLFNYGRFHPARQATTHLWGTHIQERDVVKDKLFFLSLASLFFQAISVSFFLPSSHSRLLLLLLLKRKLDLTGCYRQVLFLCLSCCWCGLFNSGTTGLLLLLQPGSLPLFTCRVMSDTSNVYFRVPCIAAVFKVLSHLIYWYRVLCHILEEKNKQIKEAM